MYTKRTSRAIRAIAILLALGLVTAGCTRRTSAGRQLRLPSKPPSALVIATPQSSAALPSIGAAISGSARIGEHLEVVDPADRARPLLISAVTPASPSMPGPVAPVRPRGETTSYLMHQYHTRHQEYLSKLDA